MSWMTPSLPPAPGTTAAAAAGGAPSACAGIDPLLSEDLRDVVAPLLKTDQAQPEAPHRVADDVVGLLAGELDQDQVAVGSRLQASLGQGRREAVAVVAHLDRQQLAGPGELRSRRRPQQPAGVDDDDVVADALEFAQQVRC